MLTSYHDLRAYQNALQAAVEIFEISKRFPVDEKYSLTDQMRRSSRSVCANMAEAWRKRRYKAAFIAKLSDAEGEACETQVWVELAERFAYLSTEQAQTLHQRYELILGQIVRMIERADSFLVR